MVSASKHNHRLAIRVSSIFYRTPFAISVSSLYTPHQTLPHVNMGTPEFEKDTERFVSAIRSVGEITTFDAPEAYEECVTANLIPAIKSYLHNPTTYGFGKEPESETKTRFDALKAISGLAELPRGHEIFVQAIFSDQRPERGSEDQKHFDDRVAELLLSSVLAADKYPRGQNLTRQFFSPDLPESERVHRIDVLLRCFQRYYENPWLMQKISDQPPILQHPERHILSLRNEMDKVNMYLHKGTMAEFLHVYSTIDQTQFTKKNKLQQALRARMKKDALQYFEIEPTSALIVLDAFSARDLAPSLKKIELMRRIPIIAAIRQKAGRDPSQSFFDHAVSFLEKTSQVNTKWGILSLDLLRDALVYTKQSERPSEYIKHLTRIHANTNQERPPQTLIVADIFESIWILRLSKDIITRSAIALAMTHPIGDHHTVETYLQGLLDPEKTFSYVLNDQYREALPPSILELLFATATDQMKAKLLETSDSGNPRWIELMNASLHPYEITSQTELGKEEYENAQYLLALTAYQSLYVHYEGDTSGQIPFLNAIYMSRANPVWIDGIGTLTPEALRELKTLHRLYCDFIEIQIEKKITDFASLTNDVFFQSLLDFLHYRTPLEISTTRMENLQKRILNRVIKTRYTNRINSLLMQYTPHISELSPYSVRYLRNNFSNLTEDVRNRIRPLLPR